MTYAFLVYYSLLILGPLIYIGNAPLASYYVLFIGGGVIVLLDGLKNRNTFYYFPLFFKCYLCLMTVYLMTYAFNFFEVDYISSIRDFIIIYAPLQYMLLINLLYFVMINIKSDGERYAFIKSIIKLHLYLLPLVGLIAILQMFDLFDTQNILSSYYGRVDVDVWKNYVMYNPRASATFNLEPNTLGLYAGFSLALFHMFKGELKLSKLSSILIFFLGIIALIFSGSFTGIIVYALLTSWYFFQYKKLGIKTLILVLLSLSIFTSLFSEEIERSVNRQKIGDGNLIPSSLKARMNNAWLTTYLEFEKEFFNGIGPSAVQLTHSADNDFLDKFLRFGLIGGFANVFFIIFLILYPLYKRKSCNCVFIRKLLLFSSLIALAFALASIPGSAFKAKRLAEVFWILYSLPFIYLTVINKKQVVNNDK